MPVSDHQCIADLTENAAQYLIQVVSSYALPSGVPRVQRSWSHPLLTETSRGFSQPFQADAQNRRA